MTLDELRRLRDAAFAGATTIYSADSFRAFVEAVRAALAPDGCITALERECARRGEYEQRAFAQEGAMHRQAAEYVKIQAERDRLLSDVRRLREERDRAEWDATPWEYVEVELLDPGSFPVKT